MLKIMKTNAQSILLLLSVLIGGIVGVALGPKANVFEPIGTIFINLMFMTITPLVFFSVASAVAQNSGTKRLGKIFIATVVVFVITAVIAAIFGYIAIRTWNPFEGINATALLQQLGEGHDIQKTSISEMLVSVVTVSDFGALLSKNNLLPLMLFSLIFGFATLKAGERGKPIADFLKAGSEVIIQFIQIIMRFAPIGLGCYFAYTIGNIGSQIIGGYALSAIWYIIVAAIYFFGFTTLYVFVSGGKTAVKIYWKNISTPALSAISTASSAACIPVNIITSKKIGIPDDIVETVIPLGANTHKDGSVIGGILKVVLMFVITHRDMTTIPAMLSIIGAAVLVGVVVGSIPSGGVTGELALCSLFGFQPELIPLMLVISTVIDIPATLLNSTGNVACSMLVSRIVDGKNWLQGRTKIN